VGYIDEVGCGAIAGDIFSCCVTEELDFYFANGVKIIDCKKLNERERIIAGSFLSKKIHFSLGIVTAGELLNIKNVHTGTMLAFARAIEKENLDIIIIDGNHRIPDSMLRYPVEQATIVKGDELVLEIGAASIIAKFKRDQVMRNLGEIYPKYHFSSNKGYRSPDHLMSIRRWGILTPYHRIWQPDVKKVLSGDYDGLFQTKYRKKWESLLSSTHT
jgi:ribonuclease HII